MNNISVSDNILEIKENIDNNINYILKGRKLDELSDRELMLLKELYVIINSQLKDRVELKKENISCLKERINNIIKKEKCNLNVTFNNYVKYLDA